LPREITISSFNCISSFIVSSKVTHQTYV
jgi:hypothetical protein